MIEGLEHISYEDKLRELEPGEGFREILLQPFSA